MMGITTQLDGTSRRRASAACACGVSPLEMADAYATLASGGIHNEPIAITKVEFPDGKIDELGKPKRKRVFPEWVAYEATKILEQNVQSGTGTAANFGCAAAGKTGTTDNFTDAWFVGYTPHLAASVWVGYPDARVEMRSVHGISVAGGTFPAQIWHYFMTPPKGASATSFPAVGRRLPSTARSSASTPRTGTSSDTNYDSTATYTAPGADRAGRRLGRRRGVQRRLRPAPLRVAAAGGAGVARRRRRTPTEAASPPPGNGQGNANGHDKG